jgi:hypothetical protein
VRLRTLSEAECYARCYGGRGEERVSFVRATRVEQTAPTPPTSDDEWLRALDGRFDEPDAGREAA